MRRLWLCCGLVVAVSLSGGAWCELVDGTVAVVGTEVILQSDLIREIAPTLNELRRSATSEEDFNKQADVQLHAALKQAIDSRILLREALLTGLDVPDSSVESRINEIKKQFSSEQEFLAELEKAGETVSDFRTRIKKQILAISMAMRKRKEFEKAAEVTEAEVVQYYQDNRSEFEHSDRVRVRRVFISAGDEAARAAAKAKLEEIKTQLAGGADFAELAKKDSNGPDAADGGLIGWVARGDLVENLETAVFALPEGGVSEVLDTEYGCVILKVEKKEAAGTVTLDEARKDIEPKLRAKYADEKYAQWMDELRKRSRVRTFLGES